MTGLADVDGFKICFQDCVWPDFRPVKYHVWLWMHYDFWKRSSTALHLEQTSHFLLKTYHALVVIVAFNQCNSTRSITGGWRYEFWFVGDPTGQILTHKGSFTPNDSVKNVTLTGRNGYATHSTRHSVRQKDQRGRPSTLLWRWLSHFAFARCK